MSVGLDADVGNSGFAIASSLDSSAGAPFVKQPPLASAPGIGGGTDDAVASKYAKTLNDLVALKVFLATAPANWVPGQIIKPFELPSEEVVSCVYWSNVYYITGTDIVRCLTYRFQAFGRQVRNKKKFEEGIFSDLRNLKCDTDAILEEPKSEFLDFLYKNNCVRTQKKQKVFHWYSVSHDRLFLDALERDLKRESSGKRASTEAVSEPALSFNFSNYNASQTLHDQLHDIIDAIPKPLAAVADASTSSTFISIPTAGPGPTPMAQYPHQAYQHPPPPHPATLSHQYAASPAPTGNLATMIGPVPGGPAAIRVQQHTQMAQMAAAASQSLHTIRPQIVTLPPQGQPTVYYDLGANGAGTIPISNGQMVDHIGIAPSHHQQLAAYSRMQYAPAMAEEALPVSTQTGPGPAGFADSDFPLDYFPQSGDVSGQMVQAPYSSAGSAANGSGYDLAYAQEPALAEYGPTVLGEDAPGPSQLHALDEQVYYDQASRVAGFQTVSPHPTEIESLEMEPAEFYHQTGQQRVRTANRGAPTVGAKAGPGAQRSVNSGSLRTMTVNARVGKQRHVSRHNPLTPRPVERTFMPTPSESGSELSVHVDAVPIDGLRRHPVYQGAASEFDLYTGGGYNSAPVEMEEWY